MHLGGLLSTQEARVALGYRLVRLLRFFRAWQPPACTHNSHYGVYHLLNEKLYIGRKKDIGESVQKPFSGIQI